MTNNELTDLIRDAQQHLRDAIELLESYVEQTNDNEAQAYIIDPLKIYTSAGHGFGRDLNLDDLAERAAALEDEEIDDDAEVQAYIIAHFKTHTSAESIDD